MSCCANESRPKWNAVVQQCSRALREAQRRTSSKSYHARSRGQGATAPRTPSLRMGGSLQLSAPPSATSQVRLLARRHKRPLPHRVTPHRREASLDWLPHLRQALAKSTADRGRSTTCRAPHVLHRRPSRANGTPARACNASRGHGTASCDGCRSDAHGAPGPGLNSPMLVGVPPVLPINKKDDNDRHFILAGLPPRGFV